MSTLLDAWRDRQPMDQESIILLMRSFTLQCLESAYRRLGLTDEEINRLLKGGRLTPDRVGRYKQPNYKPVAGITPFFKQFVENSSTWERVMIGTGPTGTNDWLASLRINTGRFKAGYRLAGIYVGLLRWGNGGIDLQEQLVPAAERAWAEHNWPFAEVPREQTKDHMWGAAWHPGDWEGTEEELIEAIGARLAALVPVLRARNAMPDQQQVLTPRFRTLGKVEDVVDQDPVRGSFEFVFTKRESLWLEGRDPVLNATVNNQLVRFKVTAGASGNVRTLTSCEGAYNSIREVGLALSMRQGDRARFTPAREGRYLVERAAPPALMVKLGTVGEGAAAMDARQTLAALEAYLTGHEAVWFGIHSGTPVSPGRLQEYRNALHRAEAIPVYLIAGASAGGDGDVTHVADLAAIQSDTEPLPPPGADLLPGPAMGQPCRVWLRLTNLRAERIPLEEFVLDTDGTAVQRGLRQPLVYVRREHAPNADAIDLMGSAPDLDNYSEEMQQFLAEHGAYMYFWTFGIRPTYRERLERQGRLTLHLYRAGYVTHRCEVERFYTTDDTAGMASPEPAFTVERDRTGTEFDGMVARTWLRVTSLEELPDPIPLDAFVEYDSGERLAPQALIRAFGYVRLQQVEEGESVEQEPIRTLEEILAAFAAAPSLVFDPADLINLHHALHALEHKHFVILHGVSGTGKSRFAQAYANALYGRALTEPDNPHYCLVPVQPTWQDRTPLLGYFNPLTDRYVVPDFLAHVLKAAQDPDRPYVLCLDEMNLAVVEHYLADFLSAWESGEAITLHDQPDLVADVPERLRVPSNLMVIGTVNMDETTHGFSPKVLDRAFTVELTHVDVRAFGRKLVQRADVQAHQAVIEEAIDLLAGLHDTLAPYGLHFAYRTVEEICRFLVRNAASTPSLPAAEALDLMLVQKVLPKLRGDDRLLPMLHALQAQVAAHLGAPADSGGRPWRTLAALARMLEDGRRYGTFQFWR